MLPVARSKIIITTSLFVSFSISCAFSAVSLLLCLTPSLPTVYTRPKVQPHHLLIRQKECNEIINVLELIMNMIKKAKVSGASLSLPARSQGLRGEKSFQQRAQSGSAPGPVLQTRCRPHRRLSGSGVAAWPRRQPGVQRMRPLRSSRHQAFLS